MSLSTLQLKGPRNALTLKKKVDVIKAARNNPDFGVRKLADLFECGRTRVSTILKEKTLYSNCTKLTRQVQVSLRGKGVDHANFQILMKRFTSGI